jgi:hypothetical protein
MTCRQQENKSLTDYVYVKGFKSNQDRLAQTMGKDFLKKFIENTREYQDEPNLDKQNAMYETDYSRWTTYMLHWLGTKHYHNGQHYGKKSHYGNVFMVK